MFEKDVKKVSQVFIVTGELSGDINAAWYVNRLRQQGCAAQFSAVGGDNLASAGVALFQRFEKLNVVGIFEIIKHLPFILGFLNKLVEHILSNKFDEVILVDFPGFNLRLAKKLKTADPNLKITYLAPPQMWCWGAWRAKKLKKFCDVVVVLYPFEVAWYKQRGINAQWLGNPVYDSTKKYFDLSKQKNNLIAIILGSRKAEVERFLPVYSQVIKFFAQKYPDVKFVIPVADSLSDEFVQEQINNKLLLNLKEESASFDTFCSARLHKILRTSGLNRPAHGECAPCARIEPSPEGWRVGFQQISKVNLSKFADKFIFVRDESEKFELLSRCCLAITKPGTVSLELALLKVPAIMMFKISWLTYLIAYTLVKVKYMSLPNLLLDSPVYKELIQSDCKPDLIIKETDELYQGFINNSDLYLSKIKQLEQLREMLSRA